MPSKAIALLGILYASTLFFYQFHRKTDQKYPTGKVHKNKIIIVGIPHLYTPAALTQRELPNIIAAKGVAPGVRKAKWVQKIKIIKAAEVLKPSVAKPNA